MDFLQRTDAVLIAVRLDFIGDPRNRPAVD